ncbi:hypothetical protein THAOC_13200, partial [Thalassiosira oceanica]
SWITGSQKWLPWMPGAVDIVSSAQVHTPSIKVRVFAPPSRPSATKPSQILISPS